MENDQLQNALADLRAMSPLEHALRYGLGIAQWGSIPAAIALGLWLAPEAANLASFAANMDIAHGGAESFKEAMGQAARWGIEGGPNRLQLYLNHVGQDAANTTRVVIAVSESALFVVTGLINRGLGHRVAP